MYERSAVVLERYFTESFYYDEKIRLKNNFENYRKLIEVLEKYQEVSEAEDKIIKECEDIASQIKQIQKNQGILYKKIIKLQEDRNSLFENIGESSVELGKQLDKIEKEIDKNNAKMRPIDQDFLDTIARFNEKSDIRSEFGKKRRKIEKEYRNLLEQTTRNIENMDTNKISDIKRNIKIEDDILKKELKDIMLKNGEKEKEPFDSGVVENSINFGEQINKQEATILIEVIEKSNNLLDEINNNAVKIKKYKKLSKDSKNKLEFLNAQKEYLTLFLDNERLSVGLGKKEHKKLMKEACSDFIKDTEQINNLNKLLLSEITGDIDQRKYEELYKASYLIGLQKKELDFEKKLRKLNLIGQILNPINWRIVGIEKIYSVFERIVIDEYGRDLSRYKMEEMFEVDENENFYTEDEELFDLEEKNEKIEKNIPRIENNNKIDIEIETSHDMMEYYDNLSEETEVDEDFEEKFDKKYEDDDDDFDEKYKEEYEDFDEKYNEDDDDDFDKKYEEADDEKYEKKYEEDDDDDFEGDFYRTLYDEDDDFYDDEENNDVYEDLETILKNRRKRSSRLKGKRTKTTKKKGIFGLGNKRW